MPLIHGEFGERYFKSDRFLANQKTHPNNCKDN